MKGSNLWVIGLLGLFLMGCFDGKDGEDGEDGKDGKSKIEKMGKMVGDGTGKDPYQIAYPDHLNRVREDLRGHYKVVRDLDLSGVSRFRPIGGDKKYEDEDEFNGTFDGGGKVIRGLKVKEVLSVGSRSSAGLFGQIGSDAIIQNVKLVDFEVTGQLYVGGLVGYNEGGTIQDIELSGRVIGNWGIMNIGSVVGYNDGGDIKRIKASGSILAKINNKGLHSTTTYVSLGGLVGWSEDGAIENGDTNVMITATGFADYIYAGGLVGWNNGLIKNSLASGDILVGVQKRRYAGTLVGLVPDGREKSVLSFKNRGLGKILIDKKRKKKVFEIGCIHSIDSSLKDYDVCK